MLVRLSKVASERAVCNKQSQIKQKKYSTIVRAVGDEHIVPDTTVLKRVLAEAGSQKSLADAYKEVLEKQNKFRTELLNDVSSTLSQSPYGSVRSAAADLTAVVQQITSEVALDITGATLPAQSLDETLQVHEIGELYSQYAKAFAALPYVKTEVPVPIDAVAESFAPVVAELKATHASIERLVITAEAQLITASKSATDLMYAQADDYIAAHPEIEAQLDEEIKQNRWDLLLKDDA